MPSSLNYIGWMQSLEAIRKNKSYWMHALPWAKSWTVDRRQPCLKFSPFMKISPYKQLAIVKLTRTRTESIDLFRFVLIYGCMACTAWQICPCQLQRREFRDFLQLQPRPSYLDNSSSPPPVQHFIQMPFPIYSRMQSAPQLSVFTAVWYNWNQGKAGLHID